MSLRDKAREVKAAGVAERGNFTPQGAPLRVYKNWARNSRNVPERENFCHFWRVVLFWAPFAKVRSVSAKAAEATFGNVWFLSFLAAVLIVALFVVGFTFHAFGAVALIVLAGLYVVAGLLFGAVYAVDKYDATHWSPDEYYETEADRPKVDRVLKYITWATLPVAWFTYAVVSVGRRLDKETREQIVGVACIVFGVAVIIFALVNAWLSVGWWLLVIIGAAVVGVGVVVGVILGLGNLFAALRAHRANKPVKVRPERVYTDEEIEKALAPREPGRLSRFFTAVADFLILATQIVRVNKWKICPLVTIDEDA